MFIVLFSSSSFCSFSSFSLSASFPIIHLSLFLYLHLVSVARVFPLSRALSLSEILSCFLLFSLCLFPIILHSAPCRGEIPTMRCVSVGWVGEWRQTWSAFPSNRSGRILDQVWPGLIQRFNTRFGPPFRRSSARCWRLDSAQIPPAFGDFDRARPDFRELRPGRIGCRAV